jgi:hypothetical protein
VEIVQNRNNQALLYLHKLLQDLFPPTPSPVRCLNCDDTNHTTAACSIPQPSGSGTRNQRQQGTLRGKCFKCNKLGHRANKCPTNPRDMDRIICFGCDQTGHFGRDCTHTPTSLGNRSAGIPITSTTIWNSVISSLSLTSRPSERRSQATTSIDALTQKPTVSTLPTTSVFKWSNDHHNTPGQRPIPSARSRNKT